MNDLINICPICNRKILRNSYNVPCQCCQRNVHKNCTSLLQDDFLFVQNSTTWFCRLCNENVFPFNHIESDNEFIVTLQQFMGSALIPGVELQTPDSMIFDPFEINEIEDEIIEFHGEEDPDRNYFNQFSHQLSKSSNYYIEDYLTNMLKEIVKELKISLLYTPIFGVFRLT